MNKGFTMTLWKWCFIIMKVPATMSVIVSKSLKMQLFKKVFGPEKIKCIGLPTFLFIPHTEILILSDKAYSLSTSISMQ